MILVAFAPAVIAGVFLADFVTTVLYESPRVFATTFVLGGIVMLVGRALPAGADRCSTPIARRSRARLESACVRCWRWFLAFHDPARPWSAAC